MTIQGAHPQTNHLADAPRRAKHEGPSPQINGQALDQVPAARRAASLVRCKSLSRNRNDRLDPSGPACERSYEWIEQRLDQVMVATVDQRHVGIGVFQRPHCRHSPKSGADNDYPLPGHGRLDGINPPLAMARQTTDPRGPFGSSGRIDKAMSFRHRRFGQRRRLDARRPHQMKDAPVAMEEIIGDDPSMTAPPDRLGTHDGAPSVQAQRLQP